MKKFLKNEITGWSLPEVLWMIFVCGVICGLSVYWQETVWGIISAVTGVLYTMLAGKGKLSAYVFGLVNCVIYALISFGARLYGETILNGLYYLPMMFVGFFSWKNNMDSETGEVKKRRMSGAARLWLVVAILAFTAVFGFVLKLMGDALPYVDSFTTVSSVIAMIVSIKRYSEQWWIWLAMNVFSVYMWWMNFATGSENIATLIMWMVYLINGIFILIKWESDLRKTGE